MPRGKGPSKPRRRSSTTADSRLSRRPGATTSAPAEPQITAAQAQALLAAIQGKALEAGGYGPGRGTGGSGVPAGMFGVGSGSPLTRTSIASPNRSMESRLEGARAGARAGFDTMSPIQSDVLLGERQADGMDAAILAASLIPIPGVKQVAGTAGRVARGAKKVTNLAKREAETAAMVNQARANTALNNLATALGPSPEQIAKQRARGMGQVEAAQARQRADRVYGAGDPNAAPRTNVGPLAGEVGAPAPAPMRPPAGFPPGKTPRTDAPRTTVNAGSPKRQLADPPKAPETKGVKADDPIEIPIPSSLKGSVEVNGKKMPKVKVTWDGVKAPNHQSFKKLDPETGKYVRWEEGFATAKKRWKTRQTKSDVNNPNATQSIVDDKVANMTQREYAAYRVDKALRENPEANRNLQREANAEGRDIVQTENLMKGPPGSNPRKAASLRDPGQGQQSARNASNRPVRKEGESQADFDARLNEWQQKRTVANLKKSRTSLKKPKQRDGESKAAYDKRLKAWRDTQNPKSENYGKSRAGQVAKTERARVDKKLRETQPNRVESKDVVNFPKNNRASDVGDQYIPSKADTPPRQLTAEERAARKEADAKRLGQQKKADDKPAAKKTVKKPSAKKTTSGESTPKRPKSATNTPAWTKWKEDITLKPNKNDAKVQKRLDDVMTSKGAPTAAERAPAKATTEPKPVAKKTTAKKTTAKKTTAKKTTPKQETPEEIPIPKKSTVKKPSAKKSSAKKTTPKKETQPKPPAKKSAAKKTAPGKTPKTDPADTKKPADTTKATSGRRKFVKRGLKVAGGSSAVAGVGLAATMAYNRAQDAARGDDKPKADTTFSAADLVDEAASAASQRTRDGIMDARGRLISREEFNARKAWREKNGLVPKTGESREKFRARVEKWKRNHKKLVQEETKRREEYRKGEGKKRFGKAAITKTRGIGATFAGFDSRAKKALR